MARNDWDAHNEKKQELTNQTLDLISGKWKKWGTLIAILFGFLCVLIAHPWVIVPAGHRGVVLEWGKPKPIPLSDGLSSRIPIYQDVIKMSVQILLSKQDCEAVTKDQQFNHTTVTVNYHLIPEDVSWVYRELGLSYAQKIVEPKTQEVVKQATARYNALELITKREIIRDEMKKDLKANLLPYKMIVDDFTIVNFKWSKQFEEAIENKQIAEQKALTEQRNLEAEKFKAQQKIAAAEGEAKSIQLRREQLNPIVLEYEALKKWDGVLPQFMGSNATPFVNLKMKDPSAKKE